jgi:uncharacterized Zn finger protein (UPF0148 family)
MSKPVGGRGCRASYKTVVIRIPVDIKPQIDEILSHFHSNSLELVKDDSSDNKISRLITIIEQYKAIAKLSRDWTKCNQLIAELEAEIG